jgi:hypothetical protein
MDDFKGYATILCLNMILDLKFPKDDDRRAIVEQIVGTWEKQLKNQLQREVGVLHGSPPDGMDVETAHAKYVRQISGAAAEIKRILNGDPK